MLKDYRLLFALVALAFGHGMLFLYDMYLTNEIWIELFWLTITLFVFCCALSVYQLLMNSIEVKQELDSLLDPPRSEDSANDNKN